MIRIDKIPILAYFIFQLAYCSYASASPYWSGAWFCANGFLLMDYFNRQESRLIRLLGLSFTISVTLFCIMKFFFAFEGERMYTLLIFLIILTGLLCLHFKKIKLCIR